MPRLYIANGSHQVQNFTYTLPEGSRSIMQEIPIGGQILVAGRELPSPTIDAIIEHHARYGLVSLGEALGRGVRNFYGLAYQLDRQIPLDRIYELNERFKGRLRAQGQQLRQEAAIASNQFLEEQIFQASAEQGRMPPRVDALEMHVEEISRSQHDDSPELNEKVRVERAATDPRPAPRHSRRRRE